MTRHCAEYLIIDPEQHWGRVRLVILDNLPKKWVDRIEALSPHNKRRLDLIMDLFVKYGYVDLPDYGHDGMQRDMYTYGCYTRVIDITGDACTITSIRV